MARGVWFTGPKTAELRDEEVTDPVGDEIQVTAICSLISPGSEMLLYGGEGNLPDLLLPAAEGELPFPIKFGYQIVGRVDAVGPDAAYAVGDVVFAHHPHQDRFTMQSTIGGEEGFKLAHRVPQGVDPANAIFAHLYCVAANCLLDVPVRIGDCVAVTGAGIVGSFAAQIARRTAAKLVIIDPLPARRELAGWIGADAVVAPEDAKATIDELTDGRGVDVFIEASGAPPALQTALDNTAQEGRIGVPAWYGTRQVSVSLSPEFHLRRQRLISSYIGGMSAGPAWSSTRLMQVALANVAELPISQMVTHRVPFDQAPHGYHLVDDNAADTLGVLLDYSAASDA